MGASDSKSGLYESSVLVFSNQERTEISNIFNRICGDSCKQTFTFSQFQAYIVNHVLNPLDTRLFSYIQFITSLTSSRNKEVANCSELVTREGFLVALAKTLKGTISEKCELVIKLTSNDQNRTSHTELSKFISTLVQSYEKVLCSASWKLENYDGTHERLALALLSDIGSDKTVIISDELERWLCRSPLLLQLLDSVLHKCFPINQFKNDQDILSQEIHTLLPECVHAEWHKMSSLLDLPAILFINSAVQKDLQTPWRLLYNSQSHGESFSVLVKRIINKGPSIIIVKDSENFVFGGFAAESWSVRPQFAGNAKCFLFSIRPTLDIYSATDYNDHYMYLNQAQETMPNGLGMGGQLDYFGFWIDSMYGTGHSKAQPACTTYNSPQLSCNQVFQIDQIEIWGLGPDPSLRDMQEDNVDQIQSILDTDPSAKAMLTLLDKGPLSDGLRETDPTADSPGDITPPLI